MKTLSNSITHTSGTGIVSSTPENLGAVSRFMSALTPRGVALLVVLAGTGALGYAVWEQRATLLPAYLGSTAALAGTGVAITMVLVGLIVMDLYGRLEDRAEQAVRKHAESMRVHADALQAQISLQAANHSNTLSELSALRSDHAKCQEKLNDMAMMIARMGIGMNTGKPVT